MADREFKLVVKTVADTTGLAQIRTMLEQQAKAGGYSADAVERMGKAFDKLTASASKYEAATRSGTMSEGEASTRMAREIEATVAEMQALGEAERKAAGHTGELAEKQERLATSLQITGTQMRINNERAVMMSQAFAGIVMAAASGTDAMSLYRQALTGTAMIMSTAGPWGIAAAAMTQALGTLAINYVETGKAAEEAAKKELAAVDEGFKKLQEKKDAQYQWDESIKKNNQSLDEHLQKLRLIGEAMDDNRRRELEYADKQDELAKFNDDRAVEDGVISQEEADLRQREREDAKIAREREAQLDTFNQQESLAKAESQAAQEEAQQLLDKEKETQARAQAAAEEAQMRNVAAQARIRIDMERAKEDTWLHKANAMAASLTPDASHVWLKKERERQERIARDEKTYAEASDAAAKIRQQFPDLGSLKEEREEALNAKKATDAEVPPLINQMKEADFRAAQARDEREHFRDMSNADDEDLLNRRAKQDDALYNLNEAKTDKQLSDENLANQGDQLAEAIKKYNADLAAQVSEATAAIRDEGSTPAELEKLKSVLTSNQMATLTAVQGVSSAIESGLQAMQAQAAQIQALQQRMADLDAQVRHQRNG
jgi:hypothetical protein